MTDFKSHLNSRKRRKAAGKWQGLLAVFVTLILLAIIVLGILRGIKLKGGFTKSVWDGSAPIAIVLNTKPTSVMVVQKVPKRVTFLVVPSDISYATGNAVGPVKSVADAIAEDGEFGRRFLTKYLGAKIGGYMHFSHEKKMNRDEAQRIFKDFAFLATPFSIVLNGLGGVFDETNLSRLDMLRLWWQVKGVNVGDLQYVDLSEYAIDIIGEGDKNFKGLDREVLRKRLTAYFEDYRVVGKHIEIEILNASDESGIGRLASDIAEISGFDIASVTSGESISDKTEIIGSGDKTNVGYLAKLFSCDIFWQQSEGEESKITLHLGRDFAKAFE